MKSRESRAHSALCSAHNLRLHNASTPSLWMVAASFKPLREIVGGDMSLISENMTLDNYTHHLRAQFPVPALVFELPSSSPPSARSSTSS